MDNRKLAVYFSWSRPSEIGNGAERLLQLNNRFPSLLEFRRELWPVVEALAAKPNQDISGFLDHVILSDFELFGKVVHEVTGNDMEVIQREGDIPPVRELDRDFLKGIDTLVVVSLDHFRTEQRPSDGEVGAIADFLTREGTTLVVCPHHNIGETEDVQSQKIEREHHEDSLVPPQQQIGGFACFLLQALGYPIENRFGLRPAKGPDGSPTTLKKYEDLDSTSILQGVSTFNVHPHLPHLFVPPECKNILVLAKQQIDTCIAPHPFVQSGNTSFDAFLHIPPESRRAGNIYVCDATLWSSVFGGQSSLIQFWKNLASA